jgi:hypothetical protein
MELLMDHLASRSFPGALPLSRGVLRVLVIANFVYGALILALLVASLRAAGPVMGALGVKAVPGSERMILGGRLIMLAGIASVPVAYLVLTRLLAIVATVRAGDPFVAVNASRLQTIAWSVLGLEIVHLLVGAIAANSASSAQALDIHWTFSITPWIAVLLLFVLARVFDEGTRMRADLEGTV